MAIADARRLAIGAFITVDGTVTAEPGAILGDRTMAIEDDSGGLFVRLPSDVPFSRVPRGAIVRVSGELAAPYGNLELRPDDDADIVSIGSGGLPEPQVVRSDGISEANEGRLARFSGTVTDIDRYSSGAVSITAQDDRGRATVYAHAPLGMAGSAVERGQRIRVTGIIGQRASRSGASDGHRLWPRSRADVEALADDAPGMPPPGDDDPGDRPRDPRPPKVRIADAEPGAIVTIEGTVTSAPGFIDSEGRRVTVQDRSGAILVRYPVEARPPRVGSVIRAWGEVGTWYDAPQLEAAAAPRQKGRARVVAEPLRRPPEEADEWQLVTVTVRITQVERDGDTWRAEATMGERGDLPIVGLAGSGIPGESIEEGRAARVTGIVRRAHPSASDQRLAIAPRSARDLRMGRSSGDEDDGDDDRDDDDEGGAYASGGSGGAVAASVVLASLAEHRNGEVLVGGRIEHVDGRRLTLADPSGNATVVLAEGIGGLGPGFAPGDVVNVRGTVRERGNGTHELLVRAVTDIWRAPALTGAVSRTTPLAAALAPSTLPGPDASRVESSVTGAADRSAGPDRSGLIVLLAVLAVSALASLGGAALLLVRRRQHDEPAPSSAGAAGPAMTMQVSRETVSAPTAGLHSVR